MKKILLFLSSVCTLQLLFTILSDKRNGGIFAIFWNNLLGHPNGGLFLIFSGIIGFIYLLILLVKYTIKGKKIKNKETLYTTNQITTVSEDTYVGETGFNENKSSSKLITKVKELSVGKQIAIIIAFIFVIVAITIDKSSNNSSHNSNYKQSSSSSSQTLICDECGISFQKSNGVQLSGHSEVFCSQGCSIRWAFARGISVK